MPNLEDLNKRAQKKFEDLKNQKGWTRDRIAELKQNGSLTISDKNLERMLDIETRTTIDDKVYHLADKRDSAKVTLENFLDSLQLPANLSIAVGNLVTAPRLNKKDKLEFLKIAKQFIEKEIEENERG